MKWISLACAIALGFIAGCQSQDVKPEAPKFCEQDEVAIQKGQQLSMQYMQAFLAAVRQNDFALLKPVLQGKLPERDQRAYFTDQMKWVTEKLGSLQEAKFVDVFRKGALCEYVWKLSFEKEVDGKRQVIDLPYIVRTVCDADGEVRILMVGFVVR